MKVTKILGVLVLVIAVLMTGFGGLLDMSQNKFQFTERHAWNDGLFLAVVAIALILL